MNVPYPGFDKTLGFLISAVLMLASAAVLYLVFKRRDWI
jgi:Mg2+ and Co2+ transporter CorA